MSDKQRIFQPPSRCEVSWSDARERCVMSGVVSNVVFNMESVLSDLHSIMGEITAIVDHIDTVTDKMSRNSKSKTGASHLLTNKSVNKYQWGNKSNYNAEIDTNYYNTHIDTIKSLAVSQTHNKKQHHNVLKVNAVSRNQEKSSLTEESSLKFYNTKDLTSQDWKNDTILNFPKNCNHFLKDGSRPIPQAGAIAIVYPTIINNVSVLHNEDTWTTERIKLHKDGQNFVNECIEDSIFEKFVNNSNDVNSVSLPLFPTAIESNKNKQWKTTKKQGQKLHNDIKLLTLKKRSLISAKSNEISLCELSTRLSEVNTGHKNGKNTTIDFQTEINTEIALKSTDIQSLTKSNTVLETEIFNDNSNLEFWKTPLDNESIPTNIGTNVTDNISSVEDNFGKSEIQKSQKNKKSMDSGLQTEFSTWFYGTENSSKAETPDTKCSTPAIDYSYLNLVGNSFVSNNTVESLPADDFQELCDVDRPTMDNLDKILTFHGNAQNTADKPSQIIVPTLVDEKFTFGKTPITKKDINTVLNSSVWTHVFCSEVICSDPGEYCGCYEAIVDSVLENTADFKSLEEDYENFDCIVPVSKTEINFGQEYEEDDWDIALKFDNQQQCNITSSVINTMDESNDKSLSTMDDKNDQKAQNLHRLEQKKENLLTRRKWEGATEDKEDVTKQRQTTNIASFLGTVSRNVNDSSNLSCHAGAKISSDNYKDIKTISLYKGKTTTIRPNSIELSGINYREKRTINADILDRSINSDNTSCNEIESVLSPMSTSSLDSSFWMSEICGLSAEENICLSADNSQSECFKTCFKTSTSIHKAKMRKLRREFFKDFYAIDNSEDMEKEENKQRRAVSGQSYYLNNSFSEVSDNKDNISESDSYQETITKYNKNINPWTAYAIVHQQADDTSDSASDIISDRSVNCSITAAKEKDDSSDALHAHV